MSGADSRQGDVGPVVVSFRVNDGDIWIDADGVAWTVRLGVAVDPMKVTVERTLSQTVVTRDLVRQWRRLNPEDGSHE